MLPVSVASARWRALLFAAMFAVPVATPAHALDNLGIYQFDAPYVPTPQPVVDRMLELADVNEYDYVADLGSGDGRIPISAARDYAARGLGVELDPVLIAQANQNAEDAGVADMVEFREQDLFETPLDEVTVLTLYLLPDMNVRLRPRILEEMRPGTRIVSHQFALGDWTPDHSESLRNRDIYLWIVPARVEGRWRVETQEGTFDIELEQTYQRIAGTARIEDREVRLVSPDLRGRDIRFAVPRRDGTRDVYTGHIDNGVMRATAGDEATVADWRATRSVPPEGAETQMQMK